LRCMITTITPLKWWGELTINLLDMNWLLSYFIFESIMQNMNSCIELWKYA
jgi:hypothetical protein